MAAVGSQGGGFRFATISTLFLAPGRYVLGALYSNVNDFFLLQPSGFSIAPGFTFENARYGEGGSLTRPDTIVNNIGYFGANLMLAAPELDSGAAGLPLAFVSVALLALSGGRRRNQ